MSQSSLNVCRILISYNTCGVVYEILAVGSATPVRSISQWQITWQAKTSVDIPFIILSCCSLLCVVQFIWNVWHSCLSQLVQMRIRSVEMSEVVCWQCLDFFNSLHFRLIVLAIFLATLSEFSTSRIGGNVASPCNEK